MLWSLMLVLDFLPLQCFSVRYVSCHSITLKKIILNIWKQLFQKYLKIIAILDEALYTIEWRVNQADIRLYVNSVIFTARF